MINQVSTNANSNVYAPIQKSNGAPYYIQKPTPETEVIEKRKDKKHAKTWPAIAGIAAGIGISILFIAKGPSKGLRTRVDKWFRELIDKTAKLDKNGRRTATDKFFSNVLKASRYAMTKSKIMFNGAPLKDALAMHYIKKSPKLYKFSEKVSAFFEKISVRTSKRLYNKTNANFEEMYAKIDEIMPKLPKEEQAIIQQRIENVRKLYNEGFSETARNRRMKANKAKMAGWDDEVYNKTYKNIKGFIETQKHSNEPFISEAVASKAKLEHLRVTENHRMLISNNLQDDYIAARKLLNSTDLILDPTDLNSRKFIKSIGKTLDAYKKQTEAGKEARQILLDGHISENLQGLKEYILKSQKYESKATNTLIQEIDELRSILDSNKRGEIQEILSLLKKHLNEKEYETLKKTVDKSTKSLNKSVNMEAELFDKIRDLAIGSAPMDLMGLISSLGVVGWGLLQADNNDERISATLKYGIPAVGGVATTLYCTLGLVSAGPSLIIGLISGALINKLGIEADKIRKRYTGKEVDENEATLAQIGIDRLVSTTTKTAENIVGAKQPLLKQQ